MPSGTCSPQRTCFAAVQHRYPFQGPGIAVGGELCASGVKLGVPRNRAPSVRCDRSCTPLKAPCIPNEPNEIPCAIKRGRDCSGSSDHLA